MPKRQKAPKQEAPTPVIIVGAGLAGLAMATRLRDRGIPYCILEQADEIGAAWRSRHPQLSLNTHRFLSGLPGKPLPRDVKAFATRDQLIAYLCDYATQHSDHIKFGTSVERIERQPNDLWNIKTSSGERTAQHVIVTTGRERIPDLPDWPGIESFEGKLEHSAAFGRRDSYAGKRVLVIGSGNSGVDVLNHLARVDTQKTWVSIRRGALITPRYMLGIPGSLMSPFAWALGPIFGDLLLRVNERVLYGDLRKYNVPRSPGAGIAQLKEDGTAISVDDGFVRALKAGRVSALPAISAFDGPNVTMTDGQTITPDVVIAATGYRAGLNEILADLDVFDQRGFPLLDRALVTKRAPGLHFVGYDPRPYGTFRSSSDTSRLVAKDIATALGLIS